MKICSTCKLKKKLDNFNVARSRSDGRQSVCKGCNKRRSREHYLANKESYLRRNKLVKASLKEEIKSLKESNPCVDCKHYYPYYVMDFDHTDDNKVAGVSILVSAMQRLKALDEIAKCDLVCSNCHRERTYKRSMAASPRG